jgi:hypothetical protein
MSLTDDNINNGSASASAPTPYVFPYHLFHIMLLFLVLSICLDILSFNPMLLANFLDLFLVYYLLCMMISLISVKLVIFYLLLLWIKSFGKLLIFPTLLCVVHSVLESSSKFFDSFHVTHLAKLVIIYEVSITSYIFMG